MANQHTKNPIPVSQRFWEKVEFTDNCWLWMASKDSCGYGRFYDGTRLVGAHRWAYEFCVRPINADLTIDHLCRVRLCVWPDHLEVVALRVNILRGHGLAARNAVKTHCPQGHPYAGDNLYVRPNSSGRGCRTCGDASRIQWNARKVESLG